MSCQRPLIANIVTLCWVTTAMIVDKFGRRQRVHNGSAAEHDGRGRQQGEVRVSGGRVPGQRHRSLVAERRRRQRRGTADAAAAPRRRSTGRSSGHRRRHQGR